jgi:hypothetical protein
MGISGEEKVRRVHALIELLNAGRYGEAVELSNPDVVLVRAGAGGEIRGREKLREWMEPDAFESQVTEILSCEERGDGVIARVRSRARGVGSGIEIDIKAWLVFSLDPQGRFTRVQILLEHEEDEARRALGG